MCGKHEMLEIADIWSGHEFMLEACCAGRHDQVVTDMADDPEWAVDLLCHLGAEELTGHRLRRLYDDRFSPPVLDFKLDVLPVSFAAMRAFVGRYHRHAAPPIIIWTTCILTGRPDSVGLLCGQMERSYGRIWDSARERH